MYCGNCWQETWKVSKKTCWTEWKQNENRKKQLNNAQLWNSQRVRLHEEEWLVSALILQSTGLEVFVLPRNFKSLLQVEQSVRVVCGVQKKLLSKVTPVHNRVSTNVFWTDRDASLTSIILLDVRIWLAYRDPLLFVSIHYVNIMCAVGPLLDRLQQVRLSKWMYFQKNTENQDNLSESNHESLSNEEKIGPL